MTAHLVTVWLNDRPGSERDGLRPGDPLVQAVPRFTLEIDAAEAVDAARTGYLIGHGLFRERPGDPWPATVRPIAVGDVFHILTPDPDGVATEVWVAVGKYRMEPLATDPTKGAAP